MIIVLPLKTPGTTNQQTPNPRNGQPSGQARHYSNPGFYQLATPLSKIRRFTIVGLPVILALTSPLFKLLLMIRTGSESVCHTIGRWMPLFTQDGTCLSEAVWGDCLYTEWRGIVVNSIFQSQMLARPYTSRSKEPCPTPWFGSTVTWWEAGRMVTTPGSST